MNEFRKELQRITHCEITLHAKKIEKLCVEYGRSIKVNPSYDPNSRDTYNCFEYALYLNESVHISVRAICADLGTLVDNQFVDYLQESGDLREIEKSEICRGDLIIYFSGAIAQHGGRWENGWVTSKWGSFFGPVGQQYMTSVPKPFANPAS